MAGIIQLLCDMIDFYFDPKEKVTYMVRSEDSKATNVLNYDWQNLPIHIVERLQPLREGKKESYVFWELPYRESYEFIQDYLVPNFKGSSSYFGVSFSLGKVRCHATRTKNEVGEPFLDVTAKLPRHILDGILSVIMNIWYEYQAED